MKSSRSIWHRMLTVTLVIVNLFAAAGLIASAYAGAVNPVSHPFASVLAMTFPLWLTGTITVFAATLFLRRTTAFIGVGALCAATPAILDFSPFNLPRRVSDDAEAFTLMSYNVMSFIAQNNIYPGDVNPVISYILREDPDIACLQEVELLGVCPAYHITPAQIDSLHAQFPYVYMSHARQAILSKFPVEPVQIDVKSSGADIACFRAEIKGRKVTIFNVHLQSFALADEDRRMFLKLTKLQGDEHEIKQMQRHLSDKICAAAPLRVKDTEQLIRYIDKYGGPNVIVCGDFNDVPGCYSLRMLAEQKLKEVYPEVGFGPMITYNAGRFYFRIDHMLYRGDFRPISMERGNIRSSDHYPIEATFEILDQ